ncbi:FMN-dependent NADH-azoreductase [Tahibacter amnicola]|uniref:FMN dependent NADH:quinone oxidoreductase n=1 Tax=Tahibacter amnicola TaxID=2976241 RepID=A0ABY6BH95_9GAMM|nr:NAD(P)H-dependent oxidoreductase [Tahibacter amnicola]UXI68956.1 NAD(P)H-dependent oxidoreductase [Tahibacter amnicola]
MKLLHLDSSPLGAYSVTRELSAAVVTRWLAANGPAEVTYRDLAADALPHWAPVAATGDAANSAEADRNEAVLQEFLAADVIVIGAPMYNFGVPSQLKAWIDRIAVAGRTFRYTAEGPLGLVNGKRVIVVSSRGGYYAGTANSSADFQESYLRQVLGFIGITHVEFVRAEGVGIGPDQRASAIAAAHATIAEQTLPLAA